MYENKKLFDFLIRRVRDTAALRGLNPPQAFGRWFAELYFQNPLELFISDGSGDAKIDLFFKASSGSKIEHHILNTKFTENYDVLAPVSFYNEITAFWQAFANSGNRNNYLSKVARSDVRRHYKTLFKEYDAGRAHLVFVTNCRRNERQFEAVKSSGVKVFHLEDVLQFMVDYIEDAMPRTAPLRLTGISTVLSAGQSDSDVPTSIVFARLIDFIEYMDDDPYDLLFARNVRLSLGKTPVNREIRYTFEDTPKEFVFSNNGITILCESLKHDPGARELIVTNPRIVNGSQTLHSIRDVPRPSNIARVMVRLIEVPSITAGELSQKVEERKSIIHKISIRSNRQNNIKKWDLVSNDDFQHNLARHFRTKSLFYERRRKEWSYRRTQMKSLGIRRGPDIREIAQLSASFHWDNKTLGPIAAKRELGQLFDGKPYEQIRQISPEHAYQLYALNSAITDALRELSKSKRHVAGLARHMQFALFSLIIKILQKQKPEWGSQKFTTLLLAVSKAKRQKWRALVSRAAKHIHTSYRKADQASRRGGGQPLALANYFKSHAHIGEIFEQKLPNALYVAAEFFQEQGHGKN